uniref:Uncharacterized protein n=2 Tax=Timema TaxID=61471 RepID=A0A7R9EZI2_9NEOP|nr:unnamed protein product [Timema bartmani]
MGSERQFLRHLTLEMFVSDYVSEQGRPQHFHLHPVEHPKEHVAFIFCSSGTTGLPKGVMITHHNVLSLLANQRYAVEKDNLPLIEGYALGFLPMYHAYGLMTLLYMLEFEATMVVMPHFNPETFLRILQEYKRTSTEHELLGSSSTHRVRQLIADSSRTVRELVPPILAFLAKHPMVLQYMCFVCVQVTWCAMVPPILSFLAKHPMVLQYMCFVCVQITWCAMVPPILSFLAKHLMVLQYMCFVCVQVTSCAMVPPILAFLAKHPMVLQYDLRSLTRVGVGAAPVSADLLRQFKNRFPHIGFIRQGYGMTETTLSALGNNTNDHGKLESVGTLVPGMEAKVIDESGRSLGVGQRGELCFRGCVVMKGYVNNPSATSQTIDHEGWLHTGDVGYYDEEGSFYIVDRLKDLIKYKGFQVPPAELEAILMSHPGVMDAAVIGVPDEGAGELPKAFVVKKNANVTAQQLVDYVDGQVSSAKKLRGGVQFVEAIPKNPSGKILRKELRDVVSPKSKL